MRTRSPRRFLFCSARDEGRTEEASVRTHGCMARRRAPVNNSCATRADICASLNSRISVRRRRVRRARRMNESLADGFRESACRAACVCAVRACYRCPFGLSNRAARRTRSARMRQNKTTTTTTKKYQKTNNNENTRHARATSTNDRASSRRYSGIFSAQRGCYWLSR